MRRIAVTGHRPNKLGGYSEEAHEHLISIAYSWLINTKDTVEILFIGMALGWDQACAEACLRANVPYVACIPFRGQETIWNKQSQQNWERLCKNAQAQIIVCPGGFSPRKMQVRNQHMIDNTNEVLAMWNGDRFGGTWNCIKYAQEQSKPIINFYTYFGIVQ